MRTSTKALLGVFVLGWLAAGPAYPSARTAGGGSRDMRVIHHAKQIARCTSCHTDGSFAHIDLQRGCVACHEGEKGGKFQSSFENSRATWDTDPSGKYGLHGEQYYPGTKFGDAPGPMVLIPAGDFLMGTNERFSDEGPQHIVHLGAYYIDRYEVTNLQYKKFIDETGRRAPQHFNGREVPDGKADHPVTFVTWYDARDYCTWAGKRLPSEAEWEKAARGSDGRRFPWGNDFDIRKANTPIRWGKIGVEGDTTPVGAFPEGVSPYGLYDMSGNVWEWTDSWYTAYPGNNTQSENYGEIYKVLRGGSWWDCSFYKCGISAPSYNRAFFNARVKNASFGFRCARDAG
jgi:formylglycine-generating enzyme required for sulfatase activity